MSGGRPHRGDIWDPLLGAVCRHPGRRYRIPDDRVSIFSGCGFGSFPGGQARGSLRGDVYHRFFGRVLFAFPLWVGPVRCWVVLAFDPAPMVCFPCKERAGWLMAQKT